MNTADAMRWMAETFLPGSPEERCWAWVAEHVGEGELMPAVAALGIDPATIQPGPGFFDRLQAAVMPKLAQDEGEVAR